jgi:hypothetical protein
MNFHIELPKASVPRNTGGLVSAKGAIETQKDPGHPDKAPTP